MKIEIAEIQLHIFIIAVIDFFIFVAIPWWQLCE